MNIAKYNGYYTIDTLSDCRGDITPLYTNVYALRPMTSDEQREHDERMERHSRWEYSPVNISLQPTETPPQLDL